jgi:protein-tyrosine phosphatase
MSRPGPIRVLMVCTGNICRSPTAEGVLRAKAAAAGLADRLHIESAGVAGYHIGEPPDRRSQLHARKRGYDLSALRARRVRPADFETFDWLLAMDGGHLNELELMAPAGHSSRLSLFMAFAPGHAGRDVPDPYYGGPADFDRVLDLVEAASDGLLERLLGYSTK